MKKLIINGLLVIVIILIIGAIIWGFSRLRAVDEKEQQIQENIEEQSENLAEQKTVVEQTQVKVNIGNTTNTTNTSKPTTTDQDVNEFWNDIS
ncbi:MAG: hypothetical protein WC254_01595 [Candidatus Woesearchaeota archaeon]|jgi:cytoskeletal protein RodZ